MPFYKSKNATISEHLTGISNENGFEAARQRVQNGREGVNQKEADSWLRKVWIKRNGLKVVTGTVGVLGSIIAVLEFFLK